MTWQLTLEDLDPALWSKLQLDMWEEIKTYLGRQSISAAITFDAYKDRDPESEFCPECFEVVTHSNGHNYLQRLYGQCKCVKNIWTMRTCVRDSIYKSLSIDYFNNVWTTFNGVHDNINYRPTDYCNLGASLLTYNPVLLGSSDCVYSQICFINYRMYSKVVVCDIYDYDISIDTHGYVTEAKRRPDSQAIATFVIPRSQWEQYKCRLTTDTTVKFNWPKQLEHCTGEGQ